MKKTLAAAALAAAFAPFAVHAAPASLEEKLEILQKEIDDLKAQIAAMKGGRPAAGTVAPAGGGTGVTDRAETTKAAASPSSVAPAYARWGPFGGPGDTVIGGYGEVNLNRYRSSARTDEADLRRFVLFFGHRFSDRLRLRSELEVEHAKTEPGVREGEVALEQAYLEYGITDRVNARAGLMLMPLGILNEVHEPTTFYGVERNFVETLIIPSTWRELGASLQGEIGMGLEYNVGFSTSLDAGRFTEPQNGLRELRTEGNVAPANNGAFFAGLNWRGYPGLLLGAGLFTGNTAQRGRTDPLLAGVKGRLTLWDVHAKYSIGDLDLRALYARATLGDADAITAAAQARSGDPADVAPSSLYGWYTEAAYHVWRRGDFDLAPFVRYERYNTQQSVPTGFVADPLNNERVITTGLNFRLHPQVVLKADYQNFRSDTTKNRVNLGVGYMF